MGSFGLTPVWLLVLAQPDGASARELTVTFIDVGQGDATLVQCGNHAALVDAGGESSPIVSELRHRNVERLDLVVTTHPHQDHLGAMDDVLNAFPVRVYVDDGVTEDSNSYTDVEQALTRSLARQFTASEGMSWHLCPGVRLTVLSPEAGSEPDTVDDVNDASVVIRLDYRRVSMLFTGDMSSEIEARLVEESLLDDVDILKVAHHGSRGSTSTEFLSVTKPEIAVISTGVGNRYQHPHAETIERLELVGAEVYRTDQQGTITVATDGRRIEVSPSRNLAAMP